MTPLIQVLIIAGFFGIIAPRVGFFVLFFGTLIVSSYIH
jgi:hypothetical protein